MKETKHTPGPWFSQYDDNGFYEIGSEAVSLRLAFTHGEDNTDEANARLIAAAPELLKALCDMMNTLTDGPDESDIQRVWAQARAAITKATGSEV